jgi:hypothetical protein
MIFKIRNNEGLKYSKISGDKNKIHIDNLAGYNSIFGEKICHGTLVASKIFKIKEFKRAISSEKVFNISIEFLDFVKYNEDLLLKKVKNKYYITQDKKIKVCILLKKKNDLSGKDKFKKINNHFQKKLVGTKNRCSLIFKLLANISSYVGNIYPGRYSLICSINLNFNNDFEGNKEKILINSYKLNKKFPLIKNILFYEKFKIEFETLERPIVKKNKFILKENIKKKIKNIKDNILIIGGSSGIGNDFVNIFKVNKKIFRIYTYNKNKIKSQSINMLSCKIDILKDLKKIDDLIQKFGPIKIFYFPTTKILFDKRVDNKKCEEYKKIFLNIPLKIIKNNKEKIISMFYPSTTNIDEDKNSDYSRVKRLAEINLKNLCKKNKIIYKSVRFPALNSKQSVSLLNPTPQSFFEYINKYPKIVNKIF